MHGMENLSQLPIPLLGWYQTHARDLPWRREVTPYRVWVSEIMLQQTRVAAVVGYFTRFLEAFPTVQALAAAPEDRLMKLWQGLGYYSRARNLQKAARQIVDQFGGTFPGDYQALRSLAGVGEYTAAAIASIAFGQPVPAVDGNLLRVAARVMGDGTAITTTQGKRHFAQALQVIVRPIEQLVQTDDLCDQSHLLLYGGLVGGPDALQFLLQPGDVAVILLLVAHVMLHPVGQLRPEAVSYDPDDLFGLLALAQEYQLLAARRFLVSDMQSPHRSVSSLM